ncbi:phosphopentomutase [Pseudoduganella sp. DS3]|uniref:Phosphopentomutase n=1 Tax=Pseudoduganella guangdongensis TaxID=2692179 RepID=A0A6N9HD33_9BURK|nr:phosphopentomutase [Pseudoduganella guangdongensis]MYN01350.1 phosphopentomutase [Pseudoduganella guangdongensis]
MSRAFILLLDSFGLGATPDAAKYGDQAYNTFGHIAKWAASEGKPMSLPTMEKIGLAAAAHTASGEWAAGFNLREGFTGAYGAAREQSTGKDTQSGHWEIAGVPVLFDWGYFPKEVPSFPKELTDKLQELTGVPGFLGNCHASGTTIITDLGDEHVATGKPILYTSADSVLQIACHEEHFGLERLYDMCEKAYELVKPYNIGRVIARPFLGANGNYKRTANRHDYAVPPSAPTLLDHVKNEGGEVIALGKISDIYAAQGVSRVLKGPDNMALFDKLLEAQREAGDKSLTFVNFVDFDMHFGHRRDVAGYSNALHEMDARLPEFIANLKDGDLCVITADHGCDPTAPGSDHTREHIPVLFFGPNVKPQSLGISETFSDIGQTIAHHLGVKPLSNGTNLL